MVPPRSVAAFEGAPEALALVEAEALVRLDQRGVAHHVSEHDGGEPPLQKLRRHSSLSPDAPGRGKSERRGRDLNPRSA
jgi:hypothetical protein